ncbi:MAG: hypothetical protein IJ678_03450, partial [Kiritimatiellae bacterium]|nr:hypothetical protein [Kiritimatiellia bacterium]
EVAAYAAELGRALDAGRFVDFYASKGWRVGRSPMRDWCAAVRNWLRDNASPVATPPQKIAAAPRDPLDALPPPTAAERWGGLDNA